MHIDHPKPSQPRVLTVETGLALFAAAVLLLGALYWAGKEPDVQKRDFSVTYIGSRMVYMHLGPKLYDLEEQRKLKSALLKDSEPLIFEHPPFEAFILSPLGALPYQTAYFIWGLINVAIWLSLPFLLRPHLTAPQEPLAYWVLWLLFAPLGVTLFQGQSSLVVLLLFSIAYLCLNCAKDFRAGLALGFALVKFQFVIPFVLILILRRKWQFLKGFSVTTALLAVISFAAVGSQGILGYIRLLATVAAHPQISSYGSAVDMATTAGFVHAVLGNSLGRLIPFLVVAVVSCVLILWIYSTWSRIDHASARPRDDRRYSDLMFAATIVISLVTGLHMFTHDLSPLMLAMLLVSAQLSHCKQNTLRFLLFGCLTLFWIPPIYFILLGRHLFYLLFLLLIAFAYGTINLALNLEPRSASSVFRPSPPMDTVQEAPQA